MTRSPVQRLWVIGGCVGALLLVIIGYFFFISPQRAETDDINARADLARTQNLSLSSRLVTLRTQNADLAKYQAADARARLALPGTSGLSDFLRTLQSMGSATLTNVSSLTVGAPVDVSAAGAVAPVAAASSASATSSAASSAPSAGPAGPAGSAGSPAASVFGLSITAQVSGSEANLLRFLDQLQAVQPRAVLITQITQSAALTGTHGVSTLQLTMQAFVAPSDPTEQTQLARAAR